MADKQKLSDAQLIEAAKAMINGSGFTVVNKVNYWVDSRGLPHREIFRAVEYTDRSGDPRWISELFL